MIESNSFIFNFRNLIFTLDITDFDLTVFNRWGEQIWETQDKDAKWDGLNGSTKAGDGAYFWILRYKCSASPTQFDKKGSVTLLR